MAKEIFDMGNPTRIGDRCTVLIPELSDQIGGPNSSRVICGTREELMRMLPYEVQQAVRLHPTYLEKVLSGGVIIHTDSTGAGDRTLEISRNTIRILSCTRDA